MKKLTFLMVLAGGLALSVSAQAASTLGSRTVAYGSETDVIGVGDGKRYGAVKICVSKHAVRFSDLDVVFGNGGRQDAPVRAVIPSGDCTRWIKLRGPRRFINRVVLRYDTYGNNGARAVVTAYGK